MKNMIDANSTNNAKKRASRHNSSGIGKKSKPPINYLKPNKIKELDELFFTDGITAYKASRLVGVDYKTAKKYFADWSKQLIAEDAHETWVDRNTRVRVRAIEGLANTIYEIRKIRKRFSQRLEKTLSKIESLEKFSKKSTNNEIEKLEFKLVIYEKIVRKNIGLEAELQQQFDTIQILPPPNEVLEAEIEKHIANHYAKNQEI